MWAQQWGAHFRAQVVPGLGAARQKDLVQWPFASQALPLRTAKDTLCAIRAKGQSEPMSGMTRDEKDVQLLVSCLCARTNDQNV